MRRSVVSLVLGIVLLGGTSAWAQAPAKGPGKPDASAPKDKAPGTVTPQSPLDELLAKALRDNPDLVVAQVKVREAEANLNQARLQVMQKVVALHQQLKALRAAVDEANAKLIATQQLRDTRVVGAERVLQSQADLQKAKAELAKAEAEMVYLFGQQPKGAKGIAASDMSYEPAEALRYLRALSRAHAARPLVITPTPVRGAMAEKIRKALDVQVKLSIENTTLKEMLELLEQKAEGVNLVLADANLSGRSVSVRLTSPVPLGAVCQLLEDQYELRFIVRDYGIVAADRQSVPPGAVLLHDFWNEGKDGGV
jgi:hypothetical protein